MRGSVALLAVLLSLVCLADAVTRKITFSWATGHHRVVDINSLPFRSMKSRSPLQCSDMCLDDEGCNGFNYHAGTQSCELIPYQEEKSLLSDTNARGWKLWLPEQCPELYERPGFSSMTVAVNIRGHVNLQDIYCHLDSSGMMRSYLNLLAPNSAYSDHNTPIGSGFTRYSLTLPDLIVDRGDILYGFHLTGYSAHNNVAQTDTCGCNPDITGTFVFDITGTQFILAGDVVIELGGHQPTPSVNILEPQYAEITLTACCGFAVLRNPSGVLYLQPKV